MIDAILLALSYLLTFVVSFVVGFLENLGLAGLLGL